MDDSEVPAHIWYKCLFKTYPKTDTIQGFDEKYVWVKKNFDVLQRFAFRCWKRKLYKIYQRYMVTEWPIEYETYINSIKPKHKIILPSEFSKDIIAGK